jgi:hypothetical protein
VATAWRAAPCASPGPRAPHHPAPCVPHPQGQFAHGGAERVRRSRPGPWSRCSTPCWPSSARPNRAPDSLLSALDAAPSEARPQPAVPEDEEGDEDEPPSIFDDISLDVRAELPQAQDLHDSMPSPPFIPSEPDSVLVSEPAQAEGGAPPDGTPVAEVDQAVSEDGSEDALDDQTRVIGPLRIGIRLYNVYLNEADEWSRRLGVCLSEWSLERHELLPEQAEALAHSLAGSSATVGFHSLSDIAARSSTHWRWWCAPACRASRPRPQAQLFVAATEDIRRLLHQFAAGFYKEAPSPAAVRSGSLLHLPDTFRGRSKATPCSGRQTLRRHRAEYPVGRCALPRCRRARGRGGRARSRHRCRSGERALPRLRIPKTTPCLRHCPMWTNPAVPVRTSTTTSTRWTPSMSTCSRSLPKRPRNCCRNWAAPCASGWPGRQRQRPRRSAAQPAHAQGQCPAGRRPAPGRDGAPHGNRGRAPGLRYRRRPTRALAGRLRRPRARFDLLRSTDPNPHGVVQTAPELPKHRWP